MKKSSLLCVFALSMALSSIAQTFENYTPIRSSGKLPVDFTRAVSEAVEASMEEEPNNKTKADKQFYLGSAFSLNRIMLGGKVLFNDPMSAFANKVADELLKNDPALRNKVRVYIIKSPYVNAFATSEGAIFINIGLLAQLENEAQLAYILAHEIVHVDKRHSLDEFKKEIEISRGKGAYSDLDNSDKELAQFAYSKEKEMEADELGFLEFYEKSSYSYSAIAGVFDILKYGHLPIDEIKFDKSFFENEGFSFPKSYSLSELKEIDTEDEDEDEESTHPALKVRREILEKMLSTRNNAGRKDYVAGEAEFTHIRNMARFELCRLQLLDEDYTNAIYNSYILLQEFPNNKFLMKNIGYSLFWVSYNNSNLGKSFYRDVEGESQQLAYLLYKLSSKQKDMDMVTVAYAVKLKMLFPEDKEIDQMLREMVKHVVKTHDIDDKDLHEGYMNTLKDTSSAAPKPVVEEKEPEEEKKTEEPKKSKYQKIASNKTTKTTAPGDPSDSLGFHKYTVAAYIKTTDIKKIFKEENAKLEEKEKEDWNDSRKSRKLDAKYGKAAGPVNKVIVVDPYYFGMVVGKDKKVKYLKNEIEEKDLVKRIEQCGQEAGVQTDIIEPKLFSEDDVDKYNEMVILDEWLGERMTGGFNDAEGSAQTPVTSVGYTEIKKIINTHDTEYAMWTISLFEQRISKTKGLIVGMVLMPPLIPILIHRAINGGSISHFMAIAFNLETGQMKLANANTIYDNNYGYVKNTNIYYIFHQLKQVDKTK